MNPNEIQPPVQQVQPVPPVQPGQSITPQNDMSQPGMDIASPFPQQPNQAVTNSPSPVQIDTPNPQPGMVNSNTPPQKSAKPKFLIVLIAGIVLLGLMTVIALIVAKPKKKTTQQQTQTQQTKQEGPQPAEAIDVEQSNNSINHDITSVNTEDDFPPTQLDDKALGL